MAFCYFYVNFKRKYTEFLLMKGVDVLSMLASSQKRKDEAPNIALAESIANGNDEHAVSELVQLLQHNTLAVRSDSIKVLYEVGLRKPKLIACHVAAFVSLLNHKQNRLQWGAMTALHAITTVKPRLIYATLPKIMEAAENGSVITNDQCVCILTTLAAMETYRKNTLPLLFEQLQRCPENQLPLYAEKTLAVCTPPYRRRMTAILNSRLADITKASKQKRLEQVLKKLN